MNNWMIMLGSIIIYLGFTTLGAFLARLYDDLKKIKIKEYENKYRQENNFCERIGCSRCGKSVSTPVPKNTVIRAWVECPECIKKANK